MSDPNMSGPAMSNPTGSSHTCSPIDLDTGLMLTVADLLIPLFATGTDDTPMARRTAAGAIEAYRPETQADYVNAARTIAFSMAALSLLGKSASPEMTTQEQMRTFARAIALNRSADQSERTMMQRRRQQQADLHAEQPSEPPALDAEVDDARVQAAIGEAMQEYLAARPPAKAEPAAAVSGSKPTPVKRHEVALPERFQTLSPLEAAIRDSSAVFASRPPRSMPYRSELLQHAALHLVTGHELPG
ncbi:MAG TPA: hypothetical protein VGC82_19690 [Rhodopila sp.]